MAVLIAGFGSVLRRESPAGEQDALPWAWT